MRKYDIQLGIIDRKDATFTIKLLKSIDEAVLDNYSDKRKYLYYNEEHKVWCFGEYTNRTRFVISKKRHFIKAILDTPIALTEDGKELYGGEECFKTYFINGKWSEISGQEKYIPKHFNILSNFCEVKYFDNELKAINFVRNNNVQDVILPKESTQESHTKFLSQVI